MIFFANDADLACDIKRCCGQVQASQYIVGPLKEFLTFLFYHSIGINDFFISIVKNSNSKLIYFIPQFVQLKVDINQYITIDDKGSEATPLFVYITILQKLPPNLVHLYLKVIEALIYYGANPDAPSYIYQRSKTKELRTPLIHAILIGHIECVRLLTF